MSAVVDVFANVLSVAVAWPVAIYPLAMTVLSRLAKLAGREASGAGGTLSPCSVVLVVKNEERNISRRLCNLDRQKPAGLIGEVIVVDDGSTDRTVDRIRQKQESNPRIRLFVQDNAGKAAGVELAVSQSRCDWIVFCDARQVFSHDAIRSFRDAMSNGVSLVAGHLVYSGERRSFWMQPPLVWYWRFERRLRQAEAQLGMLIGVAGAAYAVLRRDFPSVPAGTILDDMYVPMTLGLEGKRCVYAADAVVYDMLASDGSHEYRRKRRTLAGNFQLFQLFDRPASFWRGRVQLAFFSHKLMRLLLPLLAPVWLIFLLVALAPLPAALLVMVCTAAGLLAAYGLRKRIPAVDALLGAVGGVLSAYRVWWTGGFEDVWTREPPQERGGHASGRR